MGRVLHYQTERSRRSTIGVTIVAAAMATIATVYAASDGPRPARASTFVNSGGVFATVGMVESDAANPFFQPLGTNGPRCVTCHQPAQGWNITPAELRERFERTDGLEPIFRANDAWRIQFAGRC